MRNSSPETQRNPTGVSLHATGRAGHRSQGSFHGTTASTRLGGESPELRLVFPDLGLALQTPAFPVRLSQCHGVVVQGAVLQLSFLTTENSVLSIHVIGVSALTDGQTRPRDVCHLAQGHQPLRGWAGFGVLGSFFIKTAFVLCSEPACEGPRGDVCVLSLGHLPLLITVSIQ